MSILSYLSNYDVSSWHLQALKILQNLIIEPINTFKYAINHLDVKRKRNLDALNTFEEAAWKEGKVCAVTLIIQYTLDVFHPSIAKFSQLLRLNVTARQSTWFTVLMDKLILMCKAACWRILGAGGSSVPPVQGILHPLRTVSLLKQRYYHLQRSTGRDTHLFLRTHVLNCLLTLTLLYED